MCDWEFSFKIYMKWIFGMEMFDGAEFQYQINSQLSTPTTYSLYLSQTASPVALIQNLVFITGQRGLPKLVHKGCSFVKNKENKESTYWRCSLMKTSKCRARLVTSRNRVSPSSPQHNHAPEFRNYSEYY